MRHVWLTARYELRTTLGRRSFWLTTLLLPAAVLLLVFILSGVGAQAQPEPPQEEVALYRAGFSDARDRPGDRISDADGAGACRLLGSKRSVSRGVPADPGGCPAVPAPALLLPATGRAVSVLPADRVVARLLRSPELRTLTCSPTSVLG